MKRILLPTDFSENAYNAIEYALHFFKNEPCVFYLLHTFTPSSYTVGYLVENPLPDGMEDIGMMNAQRELNKIEERIKDQYVNPKHSFKKIAAFNMLINEMKETVIKENIDLVVMGTNGATGAKEIFLGTHTMHAIKNIKCPVLVIPSGYVYQKPKELLFATDFKRVYYKSEMIPIVNMASMIDATVRMMHIYDEPKLSIKQQYNSGVLERFFKNIKVDFHVIQNFSNIEKGIQAAIDELDIDILVMIYYKHSFIERLTREAVIKKTIFHTEIPFFVIPADS